MNVGQDGDEEIMRGLIRFTQSEKERAYPSDQNSIREWQDFDEVNHTRNLANTLNEQGWAICVSTVRKNPKIFPDCVADDVDGMCIGIEVIGFTVDSRERDQYRDGVKARQVRVASARGATYTGKETERMEMASRLTTRVPNTADWPFRKFRAKLEDIVRRKETKARDHNRQNGLVSLEKLILLITLDETNLTEPTLVAHLSRIDLPRSKWFEKIYLMMSYQPGGTDARSSYPAFEV